MIGVFEKPIYVDFDENLCAHSRNSLTGCSRCLMYVLRAIESLATMLRLTRLSAGAAACAGPFVRPEQHRQLFHRSMAV